MIIVVVMAAVAASVAWAQPPEVESLSPPQEDTRSPALNQRSPQTRSDAGHSGQGQVYTYKDGDRTVRVRLQDDLEARVSGVRSSGEHIVTKGSSGRGTGQPVFRSESSGTLMTLPGGVLLVLDAAWSPAETGASASQVRAPGVITRQPGRAAPGPPEIRQSRPKT